MQTEIMDEKIDQKQMLLAAIIGACVGLSIALSFYLFVVTPQIHMHQQEYQHLLLGLVIGSSVGGLFSGACGATRQPAFQLIGSTVGGGVTFFITIIAWFNDIVFSAHVSTEELSGGIALGLLLTFPVLLLSGIIGTFFGLVSNENRGEIKWRVFVSAFATAFGASLGWFAVIYFIFAVR